MTAGSPRTDDAAPLPSGKRVFTVGPRLLVLVLVLVAMALGGVVGGIYGMGQVRGAVERVGTGPVLGFNPAVRMVQAADALGEVARQLLWADGHQNRLAARTKADYYQSVIVGAARLIGADLQRPLDAMMTLVADADRLAAARIDTLNALPAARERVVVQIAGLTAMLEERRQTLTALERFHPDTQRELELHQDWARASKNLMGALLLTVHSADGGSGAVSAVEAHLARLGQLIQFLPDSDFAVLAHRHQADIDRTVHGEHGIVAMMAEMRRLEERAATMNVDVRRAAGELSQAAMDRVDGIQADIDRRLIAVDGALNRHIVMLAGLGAIVFVAGLLATLYAYRSVGVRLLRLRRGLQAAAAGRREGATLARIGGNDDIAAAAAAAATLADSAARRQMELQHSRLRLELAIDATGAALWDENLLDGGAWWSPGYYRMLGYEPGELTPAAGLWETLVHPDDRAMATNAAERYLAGVTDSYCATFRLRRKDGSWVWVEDVGRIQRDDDGLPVRFVGLMRDVSQRRHAELRIRQAKEAAEFAVRNGADRLADAERRLNPQLRRLAAKLSRLESGPLTPSQQKQFAEIEDSFEDLLQTLSGLIDDSGAADALVHSDNGRERGLGDNLPDLDSDSELLADEEADERPEGRKIRCMTFRATEEALMDRMAREMVLGQWGEAATAARKAAEGAERGGALVLASACRRFADLASDANALDRPAQTRLVGALAEQLQAARDALARVVAQLGVG